MNEKIKDKTIGVFFGGRNSEHDISIITGQFVLSELRKMSYTTVPVYVGKDGTWYCDEKVGELKFFKQADNSAALATLARCTLNLDSSKDGTLILTTSGLLKKKHTIDIAFPTFHGQNGEDGTVQGLFEFFNIPYAGCGVYASAVSMDKALTKKLLAYENIPTTDFQIHTKDEWEHNNEDILRSIEGALVYPVFAKPANGGSSIGISRATNRDELTDALNLAFHYDTKVVVENGVENLKDLTCAVVETGDGLVASEVQESAIDADSGMFDYEKKYLEDGGAQTGNSEKNLVIPAAIDDSMRSTIQKYAKKVFELVQGGGTLRVDFLLNTKTNELFVNEINPLPGTLYHHLWEKSGSNVREVIFHMLEAGMQHYTTRNAVDTDFSSQVLTQANSLKLQVRDDE